MPTTSPTLTSRCPWGPPILTPWGIQGLHPPRWASPEPWPHAARLPRMLLPLSGQRLLAEPGTTPITPPCLTSSLQPENIMLQEKHVPKPWIKIIDFGLAQHLEDGVTFKSLCGTPQYIGMGLASPQGVPKQPCSVGCSWDALWGCSEGIPMVGKDPPPQVCREGGGRDGAISSNVVPFPALCSPPAPEVINYEPLSSATDMW